MIKTAKTFKDSLELSKGEHSLEDVFKRLEIVINYVKSEDGLKKEVMEKERWD